MEQLQVLLGLLEARAKATTFDYSATQLLAQWLREVISDIPALHNSLAQLGTLAQSVEITTGQGQSEVWAMIRKSSNCSVLDDTFKASLRRVRDPGELFQMPDTAIADSAAMRQSVIQALVIAQTQGTADLAELTQLVGNLPALDEHRGSKWDNGAVLSVLQLSIMASVLTGVSNSDL